MPVAAKFMSLQCKVQLSGFEVSSRCLAVCKEYAAVPDHDRSAAILALGNRSFKVDIGNRVVLDMHGKALVTFCKWNAFGDRPRLQDTIHFQAEVVV